MSKVARDFEARYLTFRNGLGDVPAAEADFLMKQTIWLLPWKPMGEAPKSSMFKNEVGTHIKAKYLFAFCPEEGPDAAGCCEIIWWEPYMTGDSGQNGCWVSNNGPTKPKAWLFEINNLKFPEEGTIL